MTIILGTWSISDRENFKPNFGGVRTMKIKNAILAGVLVAGLPVAVQAQEVDNYAEYQVSCGNGAECSDFDANYEQQPETDDQIAQRTRTRRTRSRRGSNKKVYLGATLGLAFPGELDELQVSENEDIIIVDGVQVTGIDSEAVNPGTGFGGSLFAGFNFSEAIGADLELFVFGGGADPIDDAAFAAVGFFINPRYTLKFDKDNTKSLYAYVSPGLGIVSAGLSDEIEDDLIGEVDDDNSDGVFGAGLGLQLKAGVGLPLSETFHLFGQARYFNGFNIFEVESEENGDSENQGFSSLGLEAGISLNL